MTNSEALQALCLPELKPREEMKELLLNREYGKVPDIEYEIHYSDAKIIEDRLAAGTVSYSEINLTVKTPNGEHTFPVYRLLHTNGEKHPFFVALNFNREVDFYYPAEEIADNGFDVLSVNYEDITTDDADFTNGLAKLFLPNGQDKDNSCGKIAIWAWAASRVLDYAYTLEQLDVHHACVIGHSRLGKTALLAGALDERFKFVFSNDSGCCGASLSRKLEYLTEKPEHNIHETVSSITRVFDYWFCPAYKQFAKLEYADTFDQHFLLSLMAPRYVCVGSASMDDWADPYCEFLCCVAADKAFADCAVKGFVFDLSKMPVPDEVYFEGHIGYQMRTGKHFLSRHDWVKYIQFVKLHIDD